MIENNQQTIIRAIHYKTNEKVEVKIKGNIISEMNPLDGDQEGIPFIAPGLIDLQVNGYLGIDFNTLPLRAEEILFVTKELWKQGVTTFFPTVITNSPQIMKEALRSINEATKKYVEIEQSVGGIHLEGPFISKEDGPRGAHRKEYIQPPDWDLFCSFQKASGGKIKLLTLSPEWNGAVDFIRNCRENSIFVSIGHTAATSLQIKGAVEAGASMSTHLGNGAHSILPRHPNYLWDQLADDHLACSIIADGFHLPDSVLKVVLRMKGNKTILVSDCVSLAGMDPGEYDLHIGGKVVLTKEGRLHMSESPELLAGSAQTLLWGMNHLLKQKLCDLKTAIDLAGFNPSAVLQLSKAEIAPGSHADFILFHLDNTNGIEIRNTFKNGKMVYENKEAANYVNSSYD